MSSVQSRPSFREQRQETATVVGDDGVGEGSFTMGSAGIHGSFSGRKSHKLKSRTPRKPEHVSVEEGRKQGHIGNHIRVGVGTPIDGVDREELKSEHDNERIKEEKDGDSSPCDMAWSPLGEQKENAFFSLHDEFATKVSFGGAVSSQQGMYGHSKWTSARKMRRQRTTPRGFRVGHAAGYPRNTGGSFMMGSSGIPVDSAGSHPIKNVTENIPLRQSDGVSGHHVPSDGGSSDYNGKKKSDKAYFASATASVNMGKNGAFSSATIESTPRDVAQKYRNDGNEAFKKGDYQRACTKYSGAIHAIRSLSEEEYQDQCLSLLYCNRAAAYLAIGKPLEALQDCYEGRRIDPSYLKCTMRAATCLLRMGQFKEALLQLDHLRGTQGVSEKVDEIQSCEEKLLDFMERLGCPVRDGHRTAPLVQSSQELVSEYKKIEMLVPHSEALKGSIVEGLIRTSEFSAAKKILKRIVSERGGGRCQPWVHWMFAQIHFFEGDNAKCRVHLRELTKQDLNAVKIPDSDTELLLKIVKVPAKDEVIFLINSLTKVEELKSKGNESMKRASYQSALDLYTDALSFGVVSPPMAAVLYCNRAGAHHGLKNYALAMADCCRSSSLSPMYFKVCQVPILARLLTYLSRGAFSFRHAPFVESAIALFSTSVLCYRHILDSGLFCVNSAF